MTPQEELCSFHQVVPVTEIRFLKGNATHENVKKENKYLKF